MLFSGVKRIWIDWIILFSVFLHVWKSWTMLSDTGLFKSPVLVYSFLKFNFYHELLFTFVNTAHIIYVNLLQILFWFLEVYKLNVQRDRSKENWSDKPWSRSFSKALIVWRLIICNLPVRRPTTMLEKPLSSSAAGNPLDCNSADAELLQNVGLLMDREQNVATSILCFHCVEYWIRDVFNNKNCICNRLTLIISEQM